MANYDFSTLSSSDFEDLSCDLMNFQQSSESSIRYKTFKDGKDKGIDFLYSTEHNIYEHVGQAKHFYRSGISNLLSVLRNDELKKVQNLKPEKYFIFTSVDLSVSDTEEIKGIFGKYIKSLSDVYGKKDINQLIEKYPQVLENHFKLWFSDTSVLRKILMSGLEFRSSDFLKHEIERRISLFVKPDNFEIIRETLKASKSIIITGEPGVGKTMLAETLCYEFIKDDFKLHYLSKISEFEQLLVPEESIKQIFYFDDFLGSNKVEINKAKESETDLARVLKRISRLENKYFIFTTRGFLFNTAINESENLKLLNIGKKEQILNLDQYTIDIKKKMLANHIDYSSLNESYKAILLNEKTFNFIVYHQNFFPRSVEFITNPEIVNDIVLSDFEKFILENFDNPTRIWEHAYKQQIYEDDRLLLNTLFSFGDYSTLAQLEKAFYSRLDFEAKTNNKENVSDAFNSSLKRLLGAFIIEKNDKVNFINPSVIDFLENYLLGNRMELIRIAEAVCYTKQLTERLFLLSHKIRSDRDIVPMSLKNKLLRNYSSFLTNEQRDLDLIRLALVIYKYVKQDDYIEVICEIIDEISDWSDLYDDYEINMYFREFITLTSGDNEINKTLKERVAEFAIDLIKGEKDIFMSIEMIDKLSKQYQIVFDDELKEDIEFYISDILNQYISDEMETLAEFITHESEANEKISELEEIIEKIQNLGLTVDSILNDYSGFDWYEISWGNELRRIMEKDD